MSGIQWRLFIFKGIEGLSPEQLKAVDDFVLFVRVRTHQPDVLQPDAFEEMLRRELADLNSSELAHLESEFVGYENLYPLS